MLSIGATSVHAIEMCEILCLQVKATFANLLCFLMNSQCVKVRVMASFNHSYSSVWGIAIKGYSTCTVYVTQHDKGPFFTIAFRDRCC